jgi:HEAT repeat protein
MSQTTSLWWKFFRLKSFNADTRARFAREISETGDLRLISKLASAVKDDDLYTIRLTAITALGNLRDPSSATTLIEALNDPSPAVRIAAANALGAIGDKRASESLRTLLKNRHDEQARIAAVGALGKLRASDAVEQILEIANNESDPWAVRKASVEALGDIRDARAVNSLVNTLNDQYATVREASALALGKIGSKEAITPLLAALDTSTLWALRVAAANALGEIGDRRATVPLSNMLRDRYSAVREAAATALSKICDPEALDPLLHALDDPNENVQEAVMHALDALSEKLPTEALQRIQTAINRRRRAVLDKQEPFVLASIMHKNAAQKAFHIIERLLLKHSIRFDDDSLKEILALSDPNARNELPLIDQHWEENLTKPVNLEKLSDLARQELGRRK